MFGIKNSIFVSGEDAFFLLNTICRDNQFLVAKGFEEIDKSQDNYIRVRDSWDVKDIATLDFDGTLHPTVKMANIIYILKNHGNEIKVEYKDVVELWLLNPIEALCIRITGYCCELIIYRLSGIYNHLKQLRHKRIPLSVTIKKDAISISEPKVFDGDSDIEYDYFDHIYGGL